jgi:hypothetical protein
MTCPSALVHLYYDPLPHQIDHRDVGSCAEKHHYQVESYSDQIGNQGCQYRSQWYWYEEQNEWK